MPTDDPIPMPYPKIDFKTVKYISYLKYLLMISYGMACSFLSYSILYSKNKTFEIMKIFEFVSKPK